MTNFNPFGWGNSGTAASLNAQLDMFEMQADKQVAKMSAADLSNVDFEREITTKNSPKEVIGIDFERAVVLPLAEEINEHSGKRSLVSAIEFTVTSGRSWLQYHPKGWSIDRELHGEQRGNHLIIRKRFDAEIATAAEIARWRSQAQTDLAALVQEMNDLLQASSARVVALVQGGAQRRRAELNRLADLRRELGDS